jgi:hypothetical protein
MLSAHTSFVDAVERDALAAVLGHRAVQQVVDASRHGVWLVRLLGRPVCRLARGLVAMAAFSDVAFAAAGAQTAGKQRQRAA